MSIRYQHIRISAGLLFAMLAAGTPARAGLIYTFHGTGADSAASGIIQTDIVPTGSGSITILAKDVVFASVQPPPGEGPGGPIDGDPRFAFLSGSLTTTADRFSLASGSIEIAFGTPGEIAAALFIFPTGVLYEEDDITLNFQLTGPWVRSDSPSAVPEPATLVTVTVGGCVLALGWWWRRRVRCQF
jgi:hypothetical protein